MVKDSHTPQSTKLELMLIPLIYISLIASMFYNTSLVAIVSVIYLLIISISVSKILQRTL